MIYPKNPQKNLEWRTKMMRRAKVDLVYREKIKRLFREDILFAFNAFFYTLDVRKRPFHNQPFCTYKYQDEAVLQLVKSIQNGRDEVWEKSRDMGATWTILLAFFWFWLDPRGGGDFLLGSRIEDYVDKRGDMRALFPKLRYTYYKLPKWLRPMGFTPRIHDTFMKFENPQTGSVIAGESNNPNFSTGGRYIAILYDEFAKWESSDKPAWTAGGDATPCRVANSTPFGAGGQYYELVIDGKTTRTTFHWSIHPEKALGLSCVWPPPNEDEKSHLGDDWAPDEKLTSPWYEEQCERRRPEEIAQELDIDYLGAGNPVFDGRAWRSLQLYHKIPEEVAVYIKLNIEELTTDVVPRPIDNEGYLIVYKVPALNQYYALGVDVVEGTEDGDYAWITVYNRTTKSVDAVYWSRVDEITLARVVSIVSRYFDLELESHEAPWVGIETTGPGLATFDWAVMLGITNLFMAPRYDVVKGGVSYKKGWRTDTNSRNELVSGVRAWLTDRAGALNSQRLCGELMTFVRNKQGKPIAKAGCHDDGVMSFGMAIQVDEIAPMPGRDQAEVPKPISREDFLPTDREALVIEEDLSLEGRCLASTLAKKAVEDAEELHWWEQERYYE